MGLLLKALRKVEDGLLVLLIAALLLMSFSQIVMRNLFDQGIPWLDPAARILVLWLALVAAGIATRERQHLAIDVTQGVPRRFLNISSRLVSLVASAVCATIAYYSIELIQYEYEDGIMAFEGVPVWLTEIVIPISFGLMALRFLLQVFLPNKEDDKK